MGWHFMKKALQYNQMSTKVKQEMVMKKSMADKIEQYLKVLINRSRDKQIEIQRAELAETFSCVPSQVTYVISTRFTEKKGYFAESRRGGKGFVRITSIKLASDVEQQLLEQQINQFIDSALQGSRLNIQEAELLRHLLIQGFRRTNIPQPQVMAQEFLDILNDYIKK